MRSSVHNTRRPHLTGADDGETLGQAYEAHFEAVWRKLRRYGMSESGAEDAAQEAFLVAQRRWHYFEGRSSRRTWLVGIALNVARNQRRRESRASESLDGHEFVCTASLPDAKREHRERVQLLNLLLSRLSRKKREVFVLSEVQGLTGREIASVLEVERGTVYSRLRAARGEFEAALEQYRRATATVDEPLVRAAG